MRERESREKKKERGKHLEREKRKEAAARARLVNRPWKRSWPRRRRWW